MNWDQRAFGHRLRALREQLGLSMLAFGREIGTSASRIKHWEEGKSAPTAGWVVKISGRFGVSADSLLMGETEEGEERDPGLPMAVRQKTDSLEHLLEMMEALPDHEFAGVGGKERMILEISSRLPVLSHGDLNEIFVLTALKSRSR
ncbi:helix-turn-helix domain-containing protein [Bhargavaea ullalensis]|uniref:Transcriptional regulator with XRE-family HTH domain n=1 Tax=Bhargavaea ullalensis TaxID=1265685 RepID=A0ABV2GD80_9BACL